MSPTDEAAWRKKIEIKSYRNAAREKRSPNFKTYKANKFKERYGLTPEEMRQRDEELAKSEDEARQGEGNRYTHSGEHPGSFFESLFKRPIAGSRKSRRTRRTRRR
jgi:hypothetical protein